MALVEQKTDNIRDLNIPDIERERFRINGDNDKILELNTSDFNVITRLNEAYPKLLEYSDKISELGEVEGDVDKKETLAKMSDILEDIDKSMKKEIDYIFDANVSEVCLGNRNAYDPRNGKFVWEHVIEAIGDLYKVSFTKELEKIRKRIDKHTAKYTKAKATKSKKK